MKMKRLVETNNLLRCVMLSTIFLACAQNALAEGIETSVVETIDCVNYSGEKPDPRCVYQRLEAVVMKGLALFVVGVDKEPVMANALPNTDFYVYVPKAVSDSVSVTLLSNGEKIQHMDKVVSDESGRVPVVLNALYPIYNVAIGISRSSSESEVVVARIYNFYVPKVEFCLDENCEKPVTDETKTQLEKEDCVTIYARAYIPVGPDKDATDTTLDKTFYIRPLMAGENLHYYSESKNELSKSPYGYQVDFIKGRATFVIRAVKAIEGDGSPFTINSYIDFSAAGDTNFIVSQEFPGELSFSNAENPLADSSTVQDSTNTVGDTSIVDTSLVDTVKRIPPKVQILSPVEQEELNQNSVGVVWTVDGVEQDSLNWQTLEEGRNEIVREYCDDNGHCSTDTVVVFYKKRGGDSDDGVEFAKPSFRIKMVGPFEFAIVMDEELSTKARAYAVMDLQGNVLRQGEIASTETPVERLKSGSYIVKVGLGYRRVNIR